MQNRKIFSFDIDMTLLEHKTYKITPSALVAIERLKEQGHIIVLATGRNPENSDSKQFVDIVKPNAVIGLNGTLVKVGEEKIFEHFFDKDVLKRLAKFVEGKDCALGLTLEDKDYYFNQNVIDDYDKKRWGESFRKFYPPEKLFDLTVRTLTYVGPPSGAKEIEENFPTLKLPLFAGMFGADVIEKCASKAEGLKLLCKYYNIDIKDTVAFGDSMNDKEIIEESGFGIAMGNAIEELKKYADYVTDDIADNGVYNALEKFGYINTK